MAEHTGQACFHCGERILGVGFGVSTQAGEQLTCCPGCQAAASLIEDAGLAGYYQFRDQYAPKPQELDAGAKQQTELYDLEDVQARFVRPIKGGLEANWIIEGLSCAACVWLIERRLAGMDGIVDARVNLSTQRLLIKWQPGAKLSHFVQAVMALGYRIKPYSKSTAERQADKDNRHFILRLAVANLAAMQVMMNTFFLTGGELARADTALINWMSLILTLPVVLYSCQPFFINAWRGLRYGRPGMDVPVALGIGLAFIASLWSTFTGTGETHYESVTMFAGFLLIGRYIEFRARRAYGDSGNELDDVLPATCIRLQGAERQQISINALQEGDQVLVGPGSPFPCDGRVTEGQSEVDSSSFTGESLPITIGPGSWVQAGTLNLSQVVTVKAEQLGADTQISALRALMDRASERKPAIAELADQVARYFVVIILLICAFTFWLWWQFLDPSRAFWVALSVLVVTCPCALSLATPTALSVATTTLRRHGLLITRSHVLESLAKVSHVFFDKTGTLTQGQPQLRQIIPLTGQDPDELLGLARRLEQDQPHPFARAILAKSCGYTPDIRAIENHPGLGLSGLWQGQTIRLGKPEFACSGPPKLPNNEAAWLLLSQNDQALAWFELADELRPDCRMAIDSLQAQGMQLAIVSGDRQQRVDEIAQQLAIANPNHRGDLLPAAKLAQLEQAQADHHCLMVGDGLNDAPILAAAEVSMAMAEATQLSRHNADVILLSSQLSLIPASLAMAKKTQTNIRQNLSYALIYNLLALPAAMAGWVEPWQGAIGMTLSSIVVVVNAMRLRKMPT